MLLPELTMAGLLAGEGRCLLLFIVRMMVEDPLLNDVRMLNTLNEKKVRESVILPLLLPALSLLVSPSLEVLLLSVSRVSKIASSTFSEKKREKKGSSKVEGKKRFRFATEKGM